MGWCRAAKHCATLDVRRKPFSSSRQGHQLAVEGMPKLHITITPEVVREIEHLPNTIRVRLLGMVERLRSWPEVSGVRPLRGELTGQYRMQTGDYRMQFHIRGNEIVIDKVGHRDGFYDE